MSRIDNRFRRFGPLGVACLALVAAPLPAIRAQIVGPGVYAWGADNVAQLGNGIPTNGVGPNALSPVPVTGLPSADVTAVAAGYNFSLAMTSTGAVFAWGANPLGQLGNGIMTHTSPPGLVTGLSGVTLNAVAAGETHSLALTNTGSVYAWGSNQYGQLGNGTTYPSTAVPVTGLSGVTVTAIAAGTYHSLALTSTGAVYGWGENNYGQLGNGTTTANPTPRPVPVSGLSGVTVTAVAAGFDHSLALTNTGAVYAWGSNAGGELGNGTTTDSSMPVPVTGLSGVTVKAVAGGAAYSLALTSTGAVYGWGVNDYGELGNGTTTNALTAILVPLPPNGSATVVSIAAGTETGFALESDGSLWAWGYNTFGEYGNGTTTNSLTPIEVYTPTGGYGISAFAEGNGFSLAIVTPIPEPGSLGLVAAAAGLVGAWRLRRATRAKRPA